MTCRLTLNRLHKSDGRMLKQSNKKKTNIDIPIFFRYFYIYTLGYEEAITSREIGYAFEAMLESMPQIFHTASIW